MTKKVRTIAPHEDILDAVKTLLKYKISGAPVVDIENNLVGLLSEKDCLVLITKGVDHDTPQGVVADFMTTNVETLSPNVDIYYAAGVFLKKSFRRYPVVEEGKLVGVISRRDLLRVITAGLERSITGDIPITRS